MIKINYYYFNNKKQLIMKKKYLNKTIILMNKVQLKSNNLIQIAMVFYKITNKNFLLTQSLMTTN